MYATAISKCSKCGHQAGKGHAKGCQAGMRPKYVRYNGCTWHCVYGAPFVVLHIIGFNNRHTLTWGIKAFESALCDGTMATDDK